MAVMALVAVACAEPSVAPPAADSETAQGTVSLFVEAGRGLPQDVDLLKSVADNIEGNTICALGEAAAWPVQSFVKKFRDEFQAHVDAGRCVVGAEAT